MDGEGIKVAVRVRPMLPDELKKFNKCVFVQGKTVFVEKGNPAERTYTFDHVFDENSIQEDIYDEMATDIVAGALQGINGTIFAYGQTGTGKTWTMEGTTRGERRGITPRAFEQVFHILETNPNYRANIQCSYLQIYLEKVYDLINYTEIPLPIHEDLVGEKKIPIFTVQGLTKFPVQSLEECMAYFETGSGHRTTRSTHMNAASSRSHAIFTLYIQVMSKEDDPLYQSDHIDHIDQSDQFLPNDHNPSKIVIRSAHLNLVDLAGSERYDKAQHSGEQGIWECKKINSSLFHLGNCIAALSKGKKKLSRFQEPQFRNSSLTKLLKESLQGNSSTAVFANIGPADFNKDETKSTLMYAGRLKTIKTAPKVNMDPKDRLISQLQNRLNLLQAEMDALVTGKLSSESPVEALHEKHAAELGGLKLKVKEFEAKKAKYLGHLEAKTKEVEQKRGELAEITAEQAPEGRKERVLRLVEQMSKAEQELNQVEEINGEEAEIDEEINCLLGELSDYNFEPQQIIQMFEKAQNIGGVWFLDGKEL